MALRGTAAAGLAMVALATLSATASPARAQGRTITVAAHYTADQMRPLEACYREYERLNPGIRIVYQQSAIADFLQTVMTARLGGTSPDIYSVYAQWSGQMTEAGLLDVPPRPILDFIEENYVPSTVEGVRARGQVWGIPAEISTYMLVYNKALLRQAGYDAPPRTWDELREMAGKITRRNAQGNITTAGYAFGPTVANAVHPFFSLMLSQGVSPFQDGARGTNLARPEAEAVLSGMARLFTDGATSNAVQVRDFPSGTVGMAIIANWFKDTLRQGFGDRFADTVGVAPIPTAAADWRTFQYSFSWGVDARSRNKEAAWELLRWLNTPRAAGQRSCTGEMLVRMGGLTGNKADIAASASDLGDDFTRPYVEAIASGHTVAAPNLIRMTEIQQQLRNAIEKAWSGALTPAQALRQADREIAPLLADER
ncbi:extracellular solute-binding protein [Roseomonas sp. BN140053]|uniref:extracellular solute-binding protein n=1 Tax=Roseomonas sp. BN140053 TaxID=3391898 RepID=UPI0039EAD224